MALFRSASWLTSDGVPIDRWLITYVICLLLGTGTLLPWNVFITETQYFGDRFHTQPYNKLVSDNFINFMTVSYQSFNLLGLVMVVYWKFGETMSMRVQVMWPLIFGSFLMGLTCALVEVEGISGNFMMFLTFPSCALLGFFAAVLCGGVFGLASFLPAAYTQAVMAGQGIAGLGVSLTSILTLMAQPQADSDAIEHDYKVEPNAFSYFLVAFIDLLLCLVGYFCLNRVRFFRYHANANAEEIANYVKEASAAPPAEEAGTREGLESPLLETAGSPRWSLLRMPTLPRTPRGGYLSLAQQMSNVQQYRLAVLLIFFGTLSMFPGITSLIASTTKSSNRFFNDLFVPFSFVVFNATDSIGRIGSGWTGSKAPTGRTMLTIACVRLMFMPIFLFCNVVPSSSSNSWSIPVLFKSDVFPIMFNVIMGLSNGFLGSLCMMHAPSFVHPSQRQDEGTKMALSLISGCTLGCIATLILSVILKS